MTATMENQVKKGFNYYSLFKDMILFGSLYLGLIVLIEYISLSQGSSFIVKLMDGFFYGSILVTILIIVGLMIKNYKTT